MLTKTQSTARLLTAACLLGIGGIVGWWWLQQPTTVSMVSNHKVAVAEPVITAAITNAASKPSSTTAKPAESTTTAVAEDYFEQALALLKLALAGDPASQLALGKILEVCAPVAYERDALQNYLQLLYAYTAQLPDGVLQQFEQIMQGCVHFHPENLSLFYPANELFDGRSLQANEILDYLPLTWKAMAAASGDEHALIDIVQHLQLPPQTVNIDDPQIQSQLLQKLEAGHPDLLWKVGYCLPDEQMSLRVALLEIAYEKTKINPMAFSMFLWQAAGLHATSRYQPQASMALFEDGLSGYDLSQAFKEFKNSEAYIPVQMQQVKKDLQDPTFRAGLIEHCAANMRRSKPSS